MIIATAMIGWGSTALADPPPNYYSYFPGSPLELGKGFVQNDLQRQFAEDCLQYSKVPSTSGKGDDAITIKTSVVSTYVGMTAAMGIDANVSAHFVTGSFDGKFAQERHSLSDARNVSIVVQASAESPGVSTRDIQLRDGPRRLLERGLVEDFKNECGTRVPIRERLGVSLSAVISIRDASEELREKTTASAQSEFGVGPVSASLKVSFDQELSTAKKDNRVDVNVYARGGDASELFEKLVAAAIKDKVSVDEIGQALSSFAGTLKGKPVTIGYFVADMPGLNAAAIDPWSEEKQRRLRTLGSSYRRLADKRNIVKALADKTDPRYVKYSADELAGFATNGDMIEKALDQVLTRHAQCKDQLPPDLSACSVPSVPVVTAAEALSIPEPLRAPFGRFAVLVRTGNGNTNADLSPWHALGETEVRAAFRGPIAKNPPEIPDVSDKGPTDYIVRLRERLGGIDPHIMRMSLNYELDIADPESLEIFAVATKGDFPSGLESTRETVIGFGKAQIAPKPGQLIELPLHGGYMRSIPPRYPSQGTDEEKRAWTRDFHDEMAGHLRQPPWEPMVSFVRKWIGRKVLKGSGSVSARAVDFFAGDFTKELLAFDWEMDQNSKLVRIDYRMGTGEPSDVLYLTGLDYTTRKFPMLWGSLAVDTPDSHNARHDVVKLSPLSDKWGAYTSKFCHVLTRRTIPPPNAPFNGLTVTTSLKPADASVTFDAVPGTPRSYYAIDYIMLAHISRKDVDEFMRRTDDCPKVDESAYVKMIDEESKLDPEIK